MSASANVELTIEGMIALFFEKNAAGQTVGCQAGVLMDAPGHDFVLRVLRIIGGGAPPEDLSPRPIERDLKLVVSPAGITFAGGNIDRQTGAGVPQSFNWVLDFAGPEVYGFEIGANPSAFRSILHINGGEFFTRTVSQNKLIVFDEKTSSCKNIGMVATSVGLRIRLQGAGSSAKFLNGSTELFSAGEQDRYIVELLRVRQHVHGAHGAQHHGDANYFYSALGHKIPPGQKKVFSSTPFPLTGPVSPEASCLVPGGGKGPLA